MHDVGDHDLPSWDGEGGGDPEQDPGDELEAEMGRADGPYASESFGVTAAEEEEGESLSRRLAEELPDRDGAGDGGPSEDYVALEDDADGDPELVGEGHRDHDPFLAPEESAVTVRRTVPGATSHDPDPEVEEAD